MNVSELLQIEGTDFENMRFALPPLSLVELLGKMLKGDINA
jgi:hypothetical protein